MNRIKFLLGQQGNRRVNSILVRVLLPSKAGTDGNLFSAVDFTEALCIEVGIRSIR